MAELVRDIAVYLITKKHATAVSKDVFLNSRPDKPDDLISLYDTGGFPPEIAISPLRRTVQVSTRNILYASGWELIWDLFKCLDTPEKRVFIMNGRKLFIKATQPPSFLGRDDSNRALFSFNLEVITTRD